MILKKTTISSHHDSGSAKKNCLQKKWLIPPAAIIACIIWGTPFKLLKIFYDELQITTERFGSAYNGQMLVAVSIRFFLAGMLLLIFARATGNAIFRLQKKQWGEAALMGVLSTTISYYFFNIGNVNISSSITASIIGQSGIFFGVVLAHFFYKDDKLTWQKCAALLLGFVGLVFSQRTPGTPFSEIFSDLSLTGEGFMLIHGLIFSIATMVGKKFTGNLNSFVMTGWNLVIGSVLLCLTGICMGGSLSAFLWTGKAFAILWVLALASAIPFGIWYWCTQYMPVSRLSMYKFLIPVSGSVIALFFGETFTVTLGIGLVLVCISIIWISLGKRA